MSLGEQFLKEEAADGHDRPPHATSRGRPDLSLLLESCRETFRRYVVFAAAAQPTALALWVAHTWAFEAADATPYPWPNSAAPSSGKTRVLEVAETLVRQPMSVISPSVSPLFRAVERFQPTMLFDEIDNLFAKDKAAYADVLALINAGFQRGKTIPRSEGGSGKWETKLFPTFCPKMFAGIGAISDTMQTRCIPIELRPKLRGERIRRFRARAARQSGGKLSGRLREWAESPGVIEALSAARPDLPDELPDRAQDVWEPLLAIADMAGGEWPALSRAASIELSGQQSGRAEPSLGILLLKHVHELFSGDLRDFIPSRQVIDALTARDDGPWREWWNAVRVADPSEGDRPRYYSVGRKVAFHLRPFGVEPRTVRPPGADPAKGYERAPIEDCYVRFIAASPLWGPSSGNSRDKQVDGPVERLHGTDLLPLDMASDLLVSAGAAQSGEEGRSEDSCPCGGSRQVSPGGLAICASCGKDWPGCPSLSEALDA